MTPQKQTVVSFRVDQHLAEILNSLPDKSAFIREAILRRFYTICPFCQGRGVLPQVIAGWLQSQIPASAFVECTCCHYVYPTEVIDAKAASSPADKFVCTHCDEHGHAH
jgi:hypothetical protein